MNIAIVAGSNRREATSTKLCRYIAGILASQGVQAELYNLYEKPLPFYCGDAEQVSESVEAWKEFLNRADGIILATPEYHGSLTGVLKNALDFAGFDQFDGKPVLSISSAGGAVGVSSLQQLQTIVRNVHGINCPEWISIGGAQRMFTEEGEPEDAKTRERILRTVGYFIKMTNLLRPSS
ncbi:NAD(P)H-dependent FMN reductase [Paenibacillus sp. UNCCL117]|uniref:NADPH-dependent FMN reductase n=1 Tax=unclassified Paenibacillus TaxID=185978 RepID=UPI00087E1AF8|nr:MULTISPECIES: NADPH-dependent FMN reductase [unclassified Paenibacillus]SDC21874.1 NAD(P)H-dependent FMN reductase [Paenibacillus sp. cl123]SFW18907.1 NAD(P)H-dependent FMN reductase [Paenibacillus sp. UNCCL117]